MDTIQHARQVWFPASGYIRAAGPEFERYGPDFDEQPEKPLTLWMPVEKAP
jgi:predicted transcriptional regulator YdeE